MDKLDAIFSPESIAVVGASSTPGKVGHDIFANILKGGYTGTLYPVNPGSKAILCVKAYKSITDIPDAVELAIIILPPRLALPSVEQAIEKALEYNPNEAFIINALSDFYAQYKPDTEKYLEYALKGIQLNIAANDSVSASFIYLHLSNAFVQTGFVPEAERYINKSLQYSPDNLFAEYLKAYVLYAKNQNDKWLCIWQTSVRRGTNCFGGFRYSYMAAQKKEFYRE